jgi:exodeoxyribonuclease VIII
MSAATLTGIIPNLPEAEYHARPELSSTGARLLLESPARFHYRQTHPEPPKDSYSLGTAVHTKILGTGANVITYPDEHLTPSGAVSTKAATVAWADEQRANGFVVIGTAQAAQVDGMSEAVLAHPEARHVLETVVGREVSIVTEIDGVAVRARFDIYDGTNAADLKSARDASPKGFNTAVGRYGYHIQDRFYGEAHTAVTGTELNPFKFLVVENVAPFLVGVYDLDFMWEDLAKERTAKARELYRRCVETGEWPGFPTATLTPPTWAIYENEEQEISV